MRQWVNTFVAVVAVSAPAAAARANGAFPDSENIITPDDRPQEILLVTNFGLIASLDSGKTWLWSCEQDANALGSLYQLTPAPMNRLFTVANQSVAYSDDTSCGWKVAGGAVTGQSITDAYLDPVSGTHVFAIGVSNQSYSLYESRDTGATFAPAMYQTAMGVTMAGVEVARSDASVVYVSLRAPDGSPQLARSSDGGAHFTVHDLSADLGPGLLRIISIDPQDPNRVLLRFLGADDQSIALTTDGGVTATKPVTVNGNFSGFTRLPSGTILVAGLVEFSTAPGLFRSRDRGASFEMIPNPPGIRALSQRGGLVYGAANNFGDGYAIGTSTDEGTTWQPLMTYADVKAINPCLKTFCRDLCQMEADLSVWSADVCTADAPGSPGTGGGGGASGAAGQGGGAGTTGAGGTGGKPPPAGHSGCAVGGPAAALPGGGLVMLLVIGVAAVRRLARRAG